MRRFCNYESGDFLFGIASITHVPTHRFSRLGLGRTFQNLAMFNTMTARQNILKQALSLEMMLPILLPGANIKTGPDDFYPIERE